MIEKLSMNDLFIAVYEIFYAHEEEISVLNPPRKKGGCKETR